MSGSIRSSVVEVLRLLADADAQQSYETRAPSKDLPAELICLWFDDVYRPRSMEFEAAFSDRALSALAEFNATFEASSGRVA